MRERLQLRWRTAQKSPTYLRLNPSAVKKNIKVVARKTNPVLYVEKEGCNKRCWWKQGRNPTDYRLGVGTGIIYMCASVFVYISYIFSTVQDRGDALPEFFICE